MIKHILAAIDGSETSRKAGRFAADLARQTGAKLTLLLVLEPPAVFSIAPLDAYAVAKNRMAPETVAAARQALAQIEHDLPAKQAETAVEIGRAADTILDRAASLAVDHIVVGARGHGAGTRWLLGSVSDRVIHHAQCPVTVVR